MNVLGDSAFTYRDSANKIWGAKRYLETRGAQYYYGLANDLIIESAVLEGRASVRLNRPGHKTDGIEVSIGELKEIRMKYFHPGSQAIAI